VSRQQREQPATRFQRSSHETAGGAEATQARANLKGAEFRENEQILTPIDEPIVVLVVGLAAVAAAGELNVSDTLGTAVGVVVEVNLAERADGSLEELLHVT
jgi:hypothetical protein